MKPKVKQLERLAGLVAKADELESQRNRLASHQEELQKRIDAALEKADLGSDSGLDAITKDRTRLELIPRKLEQIETAMGAVRNEIEGTITEFRTELGRQSAAARDAVEKALDSALAPIISDPARRSDFVQKGGLIPNADIVSAADRRHFYVAPDFVRAAVDAGTLVDFARRLVAIPDLQTA